MKTSEILTRAADLIEEHGWMQGEYMNEKGCLCTVGAIRVAADGYVEGAFGSENAIRAIDKVARYLSIESVIDWNDNEARTQPEVVDTLRATAASANPNTISEEQE